MMVDQHVYPKTIQVRDERTKALLNSFCKQTGIHLMVCADLPQLDEVEEEFANVKFSKLADDGLDWDGVDDSTVDTVHNVISMLMNLSDDELRTMPDELVQQLSLMAGTEFMPESLEKRLSRIFHWNTKEAVPSATFPKLNAFGSYLIYVALNDNCYRQIQISARHTLFQLHGAILEAFGFTDDHAHAFFMNNQSWSKEDAYYVSWMEEDGLATDEIQLGRLGLVAGKQFKYIFDFGEEWEFQCKVLKVLDMDTTMPFVTASKGKAPNQYM
jgi:hypothetical protein